MLGIRGLDLLSATDGNGIQLTRQEERVLQLVAKGASNKEIAEQLCVSERTAKFHVSNLLRKFGPPSELS